MAYNIFPISHSNFKINYLINNLIKFDKKPVSLSQTNPKIIKIKRSIPDEEIGKILNVNFTDGIKIDNYKFIKGDGSRGNRGLNNRGVVLENSLLTEFNNFLYKNQTSKNINLFVNKFKNKITSVTNDFRGKLIDMTFKLSNNRSYKTSIKYGNKICFLNKGIIKEVKDWQFNSTFFNHYCIDVDKMKNSILNKVKHKDTIIDFNKIQEIKNEIKSIIGLNYYIFWDTKYGSMLRFVSKKFVNALLSFDSIDIVYTGGKTTKLVMNTKCCCWEIEFRNKNGKILPNMQHYTLLLNKERFYNLQKI